MRRSSTRKGRAATELPDPLHDLELAHESGVSVKPRSQWYYVRTRFLRHRLAVASLIFLIFLVLLAIFAKRVSPYAYDELDLFNIAQAPTRQGHHWFGTDLLGRDYLSRVIYGLRTSLWVAMLVAGLTTAIGTTIGSIAGYYGGTVDNLLMRFTDLVLTLPTLAVLLPRPSSWATATRSASGSSWRSCSGRGSRGSCAGSSSRCARRSSSRRPRPPAPATPGSSSDTCCRTRSARSSSR